MPATSLLFGLVLAAAPVDGPPRPLADTLFLTETDSYSLLAVRRSEMPSSAPFDEAAKRYVELFGAPAPHVFMFIVSQGSSARPPEARDTVRVARTTMTHQFAAPAGEDTTAEALDQLVVVIANAWLHGAVEAAAMTSGGNPRADVPQWLTSGASMLIAYGDVDWPLEMAKAERLAGVLSLGEVFSVGDGAEASDDRLLAGNIETAALLEFLAECYPKTLGGLMERIARGTSAEVAVLEGSGVATPVLEAQWRAWYRNVTRTAATARLRTTSDSRQTP